MKIVDKIKKGLKKEIREDFDYLKNIYTWLNGQHTLDEWMQKTIPILVLLVIIFILAGQTVECKAIHNEYLEYHETDFNSTEWFNVTQNIIIDTITNKMYLTGSAPIFEDFTTYTESDAGGKLFQTSTRSIWTNLDRASTNTYLYDTKTGELQTFIYYFKLYVSSIGSSTSTIRMHPFTVTEYLDDYTDLRLGNYESFGITLKSLSSTSLFSLILYDMFNGVVTTAVGANDNVNLNVGQVYYIYISKTGTTLHMHVYTDSSYSIDDSDYSGGLTLTLSGNWNFPYLMIPQSTNLAGPLLITGYVEYVTPALTSIALKGYAYTYDLLINETNIAFSSFVNATIGTGGNLKVYFSDDNSTWIQKLYLTSTNQDYTKLESLNYSSLYTKFELTSNGLYNIEVLNFGYTNIFTYNLYFNFTTTDNIYTLFNVTFYDESLGHYDTNTLFIENINGTYLYSIENCDIDNLWFLIYQDPDGGGATYYNNEWFILLIFIAVPLLIVLAIVFLKERR